MTRYVAALAAVALLGCQDVHRVAAVHDNAPVPPRTFAWALVTDTAEMADGVFVSEQRGWVVGPYGTIVETKSGGAARRDWQVMAVPTAAGLERIAGVATADGGFAIATGDNAALRLRDGAWELLDVRAASKRPALFVTANGAIEAWLATADGFVYADDARSGKFAKASVPAGAGDIVFSPDGESWTTAPAGLDCVPYRRARGEIDWKAMVVPPRAAPPTTPRALGLRLTEPIVRSNLAMFAKSRTCGDVQLVVTAQRKKLWMMVSDGIAEWNGNGWTTYQYPADLAAALSSGPPAGGVSDKLENGAELVLFAQRTPALVYPRSRTTDQDPHTRALTAWDQARTAKIPNSLQPGSGSQVARFTVSDAWTNGRESWVVGREGIAHLRDGSETWELMSLSELAAAAASSPAQPISPASPNTASPNTASPNTASPNTASPNTASPNTASPNTASPNTASPNTASPNTASPNTASPNTASPNTASPKSPSLAASTPNKSSLARNDQRRPEAGPELRRIAFEPRGALGWAVADDGNLYRYDGSWHLQARIADMQRALALRVNDAGDTAWLLTRDQLYRVTAAGAISVARDERGAMEALAMCPDGAHGWVRHGDYQWLVLANNAWTAASTRPSLPCISEGCAAAMAQADEGAVICAGDQLWSLRQGQSADGVAWRYPLPGLPQQSRATQLWADRASPPTALLAARPDGALLRTTSHVDQPAVATPTADVTAGTVELSWALAAKPAQPPIWSVEYCVVYDHDICASDSTAWVSDSGIQQRSDDKRYYATVDPSKLSLKPDTKVQYRVRVAIDGLRRPPLRIAEVIIGASLGASIWATARPYALGALIWIGLLLALWLVAPRRLLDVNDAVRRWLAQFPLFGNAVGDLAGVLLARRLIRTPRVVSAWTRRELRPTTATATTTDAPDGFASLTDAAIRAMYAAMPAAQAAWVDLHLAPARHAFDRSRLAIERVAHGEAGALLTDLPLTHLATTRELPKGVALEDARAALAGTDKRVAWIRGPGGVGKSHLACRVARWLMTGSLLPHPAIVVVLDANAESADALDAMIRARLEALTQATDLDPTLITALLAAGRVVLLFDGVTERSPRTLEVVTAFLDSPRAPALTVCTARAASTLTARRCVTIEPQLLDVDELLPFLSSYRRSLPPQQRRSEELLDPVRLAAKRIAEAGRHTRLTPLLVTLLWQEAVEGAAFSALAVDAFNGYVARALVPDSTSHNPDAAEQRRLALARVRALGRLALGKNYRPGRWFTRDAAAACLRDANVAGDLGALTAAGILEADAPDGGQLRFVLDPLSEYQCALAILHGHDSDDAAWLAFLATLDALPLDARRAAEGFILALAECWTAYGATLQLSRGPRVDDLP